MKLVPVLITEDFCEERYAMSHLFYHVTQFPAHLSLTAVFSNYKETQTQTLISPVALYQHLTSLNRGHSNYIFSL